MRELLKSWCVPGTPSCLMLMATTALPFLVRRPTRKIGSVLLLLYAVGSGLLTLPVVSDALAAPLGGGPSLAKRDREQSTDAVVLLHGDSAEPRIVEALRLYDELHPRWVIVSGPVWWAAILTERGVPADRLIIESASRNTFEQAAMLQPILDRYHIRQLRLVASRLQIKRALGAFRARGYDVIPVASDVEYQMRDAGWWRFVPQESALALSRDAIYEHAALTYYWWHGWLSVDPLPLLTPERLSS